jgi:hypothetical protein
MRLEKKRQAFIVNVFVDMRKQISGLAKIVQDASPGTTFFLFMSVVIGELLPEIIGRTFPLL